MSDDKDIIKKYKHKRKRPSDKVLEEVLGDSSYDDEETIVIEKVVKETDKVDKGKKKDKTNKEEENRKRKDELRDTIDILTYENRLEWIPKNLEMQRTRDELRLQEEIEDLNIRLRRKELTDKLEVVKLEMDLRQKTDEYNNLVKKEVTYNENPVVKSEINNSVEIILSDRIIHLNGVISYDTSDYITERIEYYNNKSGELPIFIIIDYSPGGSVISGYRILKAIEGSDAPIYVICKSFCASMAAIILCLAPHSYAYPNAIIMHHQIWSKNGGNLTQQRESLNDLEEWWKRLAEPFVKKLDMTLDEWIDCLYENNSNGDWRVFGDKAHELGWIDGVVDKLRETGYRENPDTKKKQGLSFLFWEAQDKRQKEEINNSLPQLLPLDYYWLYNPNNYWK